LYSYPDQKEINFEGNVDCLTNKKQLFTEYEKYVEKNEKNEKTNEDNVYFRTCYNDMKEQIKKKKEEFYLSFSDNNIKRRHFQKVFALPIFQSVWNKYTKNISKSNRFIIEWEEEEIYKNKFLIDVNDFIIDLRFSLPSNLTIKEFIDFEYLLETINVHKETYICIRAFHMSSWQDKSKIHVHILFNGNPGIGKSFALENAERCCINETVIKISAITNKALTGFAWDLPDSVLVFHEAPPQILGLDRMSKGGSNGSKEFGSVEVTEQMVKEMITSGELNYSELKFITNEKTGEKERKQVTTKIEANMTIAMALNTSINHVSKASLDRYLYFAVSGVERADNKDILTTRWNKNEEQKIKIEQFYKHQQYIHCHIFKIEKMIHCGVLCDVNMEIPTIYFDYMLRFMEKQGVVIHSPRKRGRLFAFARHETLRYAVEVKLLMKLLNCNIDINNKKEIDKNEERDIQYINLEPFFVCTEDITWKTFGLLIHEYINPVEKQLIYMFQNRFTTISNNNEKIELKENIVCPREVDGTINTNYVLFRGDKLDIITSMFVSFPPKTRPGRSDLMKALNDMSERMVLEENYVQINDNDDEKDEENNARHIPCILYKQNQNDNKERGLWIAKALLKQDNGSIVRNCIKECFHHHTRDKMYEGTEYQTDRWIITGEQMFQNPHILDCIKVHKINNRFLEIKNEKKDKMVIDCDVEDIIFLKHFKENLEFNISSLSEIESLPKNIDKNIFKNIKQKNLDAYPKSYILENTENNKNHTLKNFSTEIDNFDEISKKSVGNSNYNFTKEKQNINSISDEIKKNNFLLRIL
jgi:hypothetical protein